MSDAATTKEPKEKKPGIGDAIMAAIRAGKSNDEALAVAKAEFPDAKTTLASVNWYRNKLRSTDKTIKTSRDLKKEAAAAAAAGI